MTQRENVIANGSAESILRWSKATLIDERGNHCEFDKRQQEAFQIMTASFVLTYYRDAKSDGVDDDIDIIDNEGDTTTNLTSKQTLDRNKDELVDLAKGCSDQIVMFFNCV